MGRSVVLPLLLLLACSSEAGTDPRPAPAPSGQGGSGGNAQGPAPTAGSAPIVIDPNVASSAGGADGETCGADHYQANGRPLALFILLDQSGSMTEFGDRWTPVTTALKSFIGDPGSQALHTGLQYFPFLVEDDDAKCEVERYAEPAVPIDALAQNAGALASSIDDHHFTHEQYEDENRSGTPTRPAFRGSAQYLQGWLSDHPDHAGVVVLATDGNPTGVCDDNDVSDVAEAIAEAAAADPPIKTYVIGIGELENLEEMATAGGTDAPAFIVDGTGENTGVEFMQALEKIRGAALPCDYALPEPTSGSVDPAFVNVRYAGSDAASGSLFKVGAASACTGAADEWYYEDPTAPERLVLCPATCSVVAADAGGQIDVLLGCPTVVR